MPQKNEIEVIRKAWAEWNESRLDASLLHSEIEWIDPPQLPGADTHTGPEAVVSFLAEWGGTMGIVSLDFEIEEIIPAGDDYLVVSLAHGTGESGTPIPAHHWFHLVRFENGLLRRARLFLDRGQALAAAGLSE